MNFKTPLREDKAKKANKCTICSFECVRRSELKSHLLVHSREKPFSCKDCEARFTQLSSLKRHNLRAHVKEKQFQCGECNYAGVTKDNLVAHIKTHSIDKSFSCTECEKTYVTAGQLKKHQVVAHAKEKCLKCSSCDYTCTWPSALKTHQLVHIKSKTFKCAECGKWFSRSSYLKRHKLTQHSTNVQFKCAHCKYTCALKEKLKVHLRTHAVKRTHKCDKCKAKFVTPACLKRHNMVVHLKEKRYNCSLCNYGSFYRSNIESHKQKHEGKVKILSLKHKSTNHVDEEVFKCFICPSTFDQKRALVEHTKQHTGPAPFSCSICGSTFEVLQSLKQHQVNLHQKNK